VLIVPENSPFKKLNRLSQAYTEWGIYMQEMIAAKKETIRNSSNESSSIDLIGQLLKGQQVGKVGKNAIDFTDSDVMGNLFMFIIAGHETSANSIHFSLLLLALHPSAQRKVQKELDEIFQGRSVLKWDYEHDTPLLLNSFLAAVLNEQLRLISPTLTVPKISAPTPQNLFVNEKEVTVPPNTMIRLCLPSIHRNPNFWPHGASKVASLEDDLEEFKPERWITADGMYTPIKGSYVPFSEGQRACLGKRFAQIEILAALAVILSGYSVELAVDEWATDNEIEAMSLEERREVWEKAKEKGTWVMRTKMTAMITLQLRGACVPVRFVKRGDERFSDI
jgi:cytochrome P450